MSLPKPVRLPRVGYAASFAKPSDGRVRRLRRSTVFQLLIVWLISMSSYPAWAEDYSVRLGDGVTLKPYGLYQIDEAGFSQDRPDGQAAGFNPRRLRAGATMSVSDQFEAGFIWDFGATPGNKQRLFEAQVTYTGLKPFAFTVGVFKPSFGLESMQGAGDTLFLERADISTLTRGIAAGIEREAVQLRAQGERYHIATSLTAGQAGSGRDGDQRAIVARAVGLPIRTESITLHLGASGEYAFRSARDAGALPSYAFSAQQELRIDDVPAPINTRSVQARSVASVGPEVGFAAGRLWVQGEWYSILLDRRKETGGGTLNFNGWYAQAAYALTGKPREWKPSTGAWGAPKPDEPFNFAAGHLGAIEIGARYSTVNLNSKDVQGGRERVWSAVLNWRPIDLLRFALQYEHASIDGGRDPRRVQAIAARAQVQF